MLLIASSLNLSRLPPLSPPFHSSDLGQPRNRKLKDSENRGKWETWRKSYVLPIDLPNFPQRFAYYSPTWWELRPRNKKNLAPPPDSQQTPSQPLAPGPHSPSPSRRLGLLLPLPQAKKKKYPKRPPSLRPPLPATGVSQALRARSVSGSVPESRGHSLDTFWTLRSPGPEGPWRHSVGHSRRHPGFPGHSQGHSRRHFGPEEPERPL